MTNLPQIIVKQDLKQEIWSFYSFLNHSEFPELRYSVLGAYPKLENTLNKSKDEVLQILEQFINDFYKKHENIISTINNEATNLLEQESPQALKMLGNIMEYKWKEKITYFAIPTILPFSPFRKNSFSFSILSKIKENKGCRPKNILRIAIHEISHIIFLEQLEKIEEKESIKLSTDVKHYLKEALTASLSNQEPLKGLLELKDYQGNPEIRELYLEDDGEKIKIADYITKQYLKTRKNNKSFEKFLTDLIKTFNKKSDEFTEKRNMWRVLWKKHKMKLFKDLYILDDYKKSIKINRD